jgi:hypothetical protein
MAKPPKELIEEALEAIQACVECKERPSPDSHTVVEVSGLDEPRLPRSLARYAVGFLAGWVELDATIAARLAMQGVEKRPELLRLVEKVVTPPAGATDEQLEIWRQTWRNAWLAEIFTHAIFVIHRDLTSDFLAGAVLALHRPHPQPKRQGLDTIAIYGEGEVAVMTIGETKATAGNPSGELTNACDMFDSVETGGFGPDIRDAIDILGRILPEDMQSQVVEALWRENLCYLPAMFHQTEFDASTRRERLAKLPPIAARKRVVLCRLADFEEFFERVAAAMPPAVDELLI